MRLRPWIAVAALAVLPGCRFRTSPAGAVEAPRPAPRVHCLRAQTACPDADACVAACTAGNLEACSNVVDRGSDVETPPGDVERARRALVRACGTEPACGCYFLAQAPAVGTSDDDRLQLLRRSCDGGSVEGCDALYEAELARCNADPPDLDACHAAKRIPGALATNTGTPPEWTGPLGTRWFSGCWRRALQRADEPTLFCFEQDRYFVWLPRGGWDAFDVTWTLDGLRGAWAGHVGNLRQLEIEARVEPGTAWFRALDVQYGWGELSRSWGHPGTLERLPPARTRELEAVVRRLPSIKSVCDAADRCAESAKRQLSLPGPLGERATALYAPRLPSLMACRDAAAQSIAAFSWHGILDVARGHTPPAVPAVCRAALPGP